MSTSFENRKSLLQKAILEQFSQIEMDIQYSSLWVAKNGRSLWKRFFQVLSIILNAIPIVIELLIAVDVISTDFQSAWTIIIVLLFAVMLSIFNYFGIETISSLNEMKAKALMRLNHDLTAYKFELEDLYHESLSISTIQELDSLKEKFARLREKNIEKENTHDELTGILDKRIEKQAYEITEKIMINRKLYYDDETM